MVGVNSVLSYQKGEHEDLDGKWEKYRRTHIFKGEAWSYALTDQESDIVTEIWRVKKLTPWKLTFRQVSTWVKLSERVVEYRKRVQRENARLRNYKLREKFRAAAKQGDKSAKERIEAIKKANRENMAKKRRRKRKDSGSK